MPRGLCIKKKRFQHEHDNSLWLFCTLRNTLLLRASLNVWSGADSRLLHLANHPIRHIFRKKDESQRLSFARSDLFSLIIPANVALLSLYMQKNQPKIDFSVLWRQCKLIPCVWQLVFEVHFAMLTGTLCTWLVTNCLKKCQIKKKHSSRLLN